ncbi:MULTISPECIES: TRAP transporter large permease [unclassified Caballeronia]|uniref:TRAP transporter large permease n=1 Tax=unclassified Caballeronia TaxID=2646786 RepID=UPI0020295116|nr:MULTISPECIES: TRAP transporter large permease subunit [unclassified Caballeronia]MDR5773192.1 TRAP transporter large permease subunit [Caballeronia sp. LZ002]MDR5800215.1 TRAP transporter large permease subunit [Caballeronia sp. LZ001]MDR5848626.1 TRAP transporter large permease subunit [Caballeronia sp. LZ003]
MGTILTTMAVLLFGGLSIGIWVGLTLAITGSLALFIFRSIPVDRLIAQYAWNVMTTQELLALPLFIVMGEILFRTRISTSLFKGLAPWASLLPGKLLHSNVIGCSIFAAISGSSAATTQIVGRVTLAELNRRNYDKRISMGSLAGAGTLGFLVPPSNIMIVYGVLAQVSVLKLFAAGLIPAILLASCFMAWIMIHTTWNKSLIPEEESFATMPWRERFASLKHLAPVALLIGAVLGSMYGGLVTPSEAAAAGVVGALAIAGFQKDLSVAKLKEVGLGAVKTCSMIALIILGASILGSASAFLGVGQAAATFVQELHLSPVALLFVLFIGYILLGSFLEGFSIIVITLPIVLPMVLAAGFNAIWFGIFLVIAVEIVQVHPPIGFNLFVIQGITGEKLSVITKATLPYLVLLILFGIALIVFPQIALWLPEQLGLK